MTEGNARPPFAAALEQAAERRRDELRQRRLRPLRWLADGRIATGQDDARALFDFCSNDYLGLARDPAQGAALAAAAREYGSGAGSAHAVVGHHQQHQRLEAELADWLQRPRALLFSSGWSAALGTITALLGRHDLCVQDRLNHACLLDGARLAQARLQRYAHAQATAAEALLAAEPERRALLISDGLFSMDGDYAPLAELAQVCSRQGAWLMIDEAHALGVCGVEGAGSAAAAGLDGEQVPVLMGTFGKALGGFGAFIAGSELLIDALINQARAHLFTTAMPPAWASAMSAALGRVRGAEDLRQALALRIARFRTRGSELGLPLSDSLSPIQPLILGSAARALDWEAALYAAGYAVKAIRPPTVPAGQARLRITLNVRQPLATIDALAEQLARLHDASPAPLAEVDHAS